MKTIYSDKNIRISKNNFIVYILAEKSAMQVNARLFYLLDVVKFAIENSYLSQLLSKYRGKKHAYEKEHLYYRLLPS